MAEFIGAHVTRDFFNRILHPLMMEALANDKEINTDPLLLSRFLQNLYQKLLLEIDEIQSAHIASTREIRQYLIQLHQLSLAMRREWADVIET